jgi:hypothetical protein
MVETEQFVRYLTAAVSLVSVLEGERSLLTCCDGARNSKIGNHEK